MTETKGTFVIKGQRTNLDFEFTSGEYKLSLVLHNHTTRAM